MCDRISVRVLRECVLCCVVEDEKGVMNEIFVMN